MILLGQKRGCTYCFGNLNFDFPMTTNNKGNQLHPIRSANTLAFGRIKFFSRVQKRDVPRSLLLGDKGKRTRKMADSQLKIETLILVHK